MATGPSASEINLEPGKGKARFLAIKDAWQLCRWADLLYGCDGHWWQAHNGVPQFEGPKATADRIIARRWGFLWVEIGSAQKHDMLFGQVGAVGWGGNSGFHAINLAAQFGARRILLVGFDMRVDKGPHFFGDHKYDRRPTEKSVSQWRALLDAQAPVLKARGIEVINCSPVSALRGFPKQSLEASLEAVVG